MKPIPAIAKVELVGGPLCGRTVARIASTGEIAINYYGGIAFYRIEAGGATAIYEKG